jgi:hypothetical protein
MQYLGPRGGGVNIAKIFTPAPLNASGFVTDVLEKYDIFNSI